MGYLSRFELSFDHESDELVEFLEDNSDSLYYLVWTDPHVSLNWYDFVKDMKKFSKMFPNTLMSLRVDGEDYDDLSMYYFKDGKYQISTPIFEPFDESKLK